MVKRKSTEEETESSDDDINISSLASKISLSLAQKLFADSVIFQSKTTHPEKKSKTATNLESGLSSLIAHNAKKERKSHNVLGGTSQLSIPGNAPTSVLDGKSFLTDQSSPPINPNEKRRLEKKEIKDTSGASWFNMGAPALTPDVKASLKFIALRSALDPKRFYKKDKTLTKFPKYFELGTVVAGPADTFSGRMPKSQRRATVVDEILDDVQQRQYVKRRYTQLQAARAPDPNRRKFKAKGDRSKASKSASKKK